MKDQGLINCNYYDDEEGFILVMEDMGLRKGEVKVSVTKWFLTLILLEVQK